MNFNEVVKRLNSLETFPKERPRTERMLEVLKLKPWFKTLDPNKIIVVAGTNGKGTTCAALETLLLSVDQNVGLFTSPHLVSATERIRVNGKDISEQQFVELFLNHMQIIEQFRLTHFDALALMAGEYFFSGRYLEPLDYVILEVGVGGLYDSTNAFPHNHSVVTKLGLDHEQILGPTLLDIAKNKFGIVKPNTHVVALGLPPEVKNEIELNLRNINSKLVLAPEFLVRRSHAGVIAETHWGDLTTNMIGHRAFENINLALTMFDQLGFEVSQVLKKPVCINWSGRMQKIDWANQLWPNLECPFYVSGDHNVQGVQSLVKLLIEEFKWKTIHVVIGIAQGKNASEMIAHLDPLPNLKLYLTETPYKSISLKDYPRFSQALSDQDIEVKDLLGRIKAESEDLVILTGSLYLVGKLLSFNPKLKV